MTSFFLSKMRVPYGVKYLVDRFYKFFGKDYAAASMVSLPQRRLHASPRGRAYAPSAVSFSFSLRPTVASVRQQRPS